MLHRIPQAPTGGEPLNQLDQLVQRAQRKLGNVATAQAPQAGPAEELDFANPEALGQFLGQVTNAAADASPCSCTVMGNST